MARKAVVGIGLLVLLAALPRAQAERAAGFKVIASPNVKGTSLSRQVLSAVFLGKVERWGDGTRITPVDLSAMSPVRGTFSETVLGMPTIAVRRYWEQRLMGGGGTPPMVKASEEAMIEAVAANDGAIGYVSAELPVPETVKVLAIQ
jgi:ABC-type phosphate transport system substrate-binding protein